jgi:phosphatidate cytidylyltransferase
MLISFVLLMIVSAYFLANYGKYNNSDFAATILSMAYIPGTLIFFIAILSLQNGMQLIYLVLAGTVAADTFAYFTGVLFGSHKIIPKVSPKKTWEGSVGGVIGSMIVVYTIGRLLNNSGQSINYAVLGFLTGTVSQLGDWTASLFKRNSGIKDFGSIIPGHGGILDRCDSFLFTAPAVYFFALFFVFK